MTRYRTKSQKDIRLFYDPRHEEPGVPKGVGAPDMSKDVYTPGSNPLLIEEDEERLKQDILAYYKAHPDVYPSDVAMALKIDALKVAELALILQEEGLLEASE